MSVGLRRRFLLILVYLTLYLDRNPIGVYYTRMFIFRSLDVSCRSTLWQIIILRIISESSHLQFFLRHLVERFKINTRIGTVLSQVIQLPIFRPFIFNAYSMVVFLSINSYIFHLILGFLNSSCTLIL